MPDVELEAAWDSKAVTDAVAAAAVATCEADVAGTAAMDGAAACIDDSMPPNVAAEAAGGTFDDDADAAHDAIERS